MAPEPPKEGGRSDGWMYFCRSRLASELSSIRSCTDLGSTPAMTFQADPRKKGTFTTTMRVTRSGK
jgi:hypothetical protein